MIRIEFSKNEIDLLFEEKDKNNHFKIRKKAEVLYLKSLNFSHSDIQRITRISRPTLATYIKEYKEGGVKKIKELNFYRPISELDKHSEALKKYFDEHPPQNSNEALMIIEEKTGIKRSPTQIREFLKRIGLKIRKVGFVPGKLCNEEKQKEQEDFKKKKLEPRLEEAIAGKRKVYFVDAVHFVMGAFLGCLWCFKRCFIKSSSGRQRYNILGAIDAITKEFIAVANDGYIDSISFCELLKQIANENILIPITVILDNAKYQKCDLVKECAKGLGIELLYLPSYSPNLNLIERLWKFVKKKCLYSKYYSDFGKFKKAIRDVLINLDDYKNETETLLSLKFQTFKNVKIVTV
jgi:transposase